MVAAAGPKSPREIPTTWFAMLEVARETGDLERQAEATENLRRLGVTVTFNEAEAAS